MCALVPSNAIRDVSHNLCHSREKTMKPRRILLAQTLLSAPLAAGLLLSAVSVHAQPVQGLYIAGEGGGTLNQDQRVKSTANFPDGRDRWKAGAVGIGSIGWGLGNGFRVEVEGDYRNMGYQRLVTNTMSTKGDGRRQTYGVMVNALFDLDIGKPWLFPYFGAGVGYGWTATHASLVGHNAAGGSTTQQIGGTYGNATYQGIFGLSFPVPWVVGLSATAEYRFWTMFGPQSHGVTSIGNIGGTQIAQGVSTVSGTHKTVTDFNHSMMLGLRYEFNPAPPPPPPAAAIAAPAPQAARSYLVFFDWDKADLTDRARSIVNEAAQAAAHVAVTRITVSGYTDNSSAHPGEKAGEEYNMKLSLRRATAVKAELMRDGIAGSTIDIHGYGDTHPLVQTGPNTKEAQNRRVEIILR
ncbi:OmpA family protein [Acetobacter syzygii]|uniref:OmpA family protein n=1 Tax=Acetobacter syzygii TaxID=146476 RepID=UPI001570AC81|nr:OmpA family protein [Acetobacter syzygii]NSL92219.1 OmpA family protein [Acetobacter syzygii]